MNFLLNMHPAVSLLILCSITVSLSYFGLRIVRRYFNQETLKENHEVGGFIFNAFGLIYAVLIAFVVFATWTEYDDSKKNVDMEAIEISDLYHNSAALPEPYRQQAAPLLKSYVEAVIYDEWSRLEYGELSPEARESINKLWKFYTGIDRTRIINEITYRESIRHLNDLAERRRTRLFDSTNNIPGIIWVALFFGAAGTILYTYFFSAKNIRHQFLMTSALTVLNTLILYMIVMLDNPFRGYIKIDFSPFEYTLHLLNSGM